MSGVIHSNVFQVKLVGLEKKVDSPKLFLVVSCKES
jgi:hypothetical protein